MTPGRVLGTSKTEGSANPFGSRLNCILINLVNPTLAKGPYATQALR